MNELRRSFLELVAEYDGSPMFSFIRPDELHIQMWFWIIDDGLGNSVQGNTPTHYSLLELLTDIRIQIKQAQEFKAS